MDDELTRALDDARKSVPPIDPEALAPYRALGWRAPLTSLPTMQLDDVSAIPFLVDIDGVEEYQHRARLRAGDGDLFAASTPQNETYERYCHERLGLGEVEFVLATNGRDKLAVADACARGAAFESICERARRAGGLVLHPYMGIEAVWELARGVAERTETSVGVLAPPPPVTWVANDKASFSDVVSRVLGAEYLVETHSAAGVRELVDHLTRLAARHRRVALKRLRCASAMGNAVFESASLGCMDRAALETRVRAFLRRTEWDGREQVLAVAWEETEFSPSTQLWIPPADAGPPRLDGIYEQILAGKRRVFVGSRPSRLGERVDRALGSTSLRVAAGLQSLGYVGRCSFDLLVVGDPEGDFELRFTECNGRWGGTSTPMALLDRLLDRPAGTPRPPYRAQDYAHPGLVGVDFGELQAAVGDQAYDPRTGRGRFVFYNVGPLEQFGKLDVIALGASQEAAEAAVEEELPRMLGLG